MQLLRDNLVSYPQFSRTNNTLTNGTRPSGLHRRPSRLLLRRSQLRLPRHLPPLHPLRRHQRQPSNCLDFGSWEASLAQRGERGFMDGCSVDCAIVSPQYTALSQSRHTYHIITNMDCQKRDLSAYHLHALSSLMGERPSYLCTLFRTLGMKSH